jgi:hypothetical protein
LAERPLWVFFPLAFLLSWYPWLLSFLGVRASGINPRGVLVAALIVTAASGGWPGLKAVLLRIIRVRFGRLWWIYTLVWVAGASIVAWRAGPALTGLRKGRR